MKRKMKFVASVVLLGILAGCGTLECGNQSTRAMELDRPRFEHNLR